MDYISSDGRVIEFYPYLEYLESIKHKLAPHVFDFASNPEHYSLESHSSLHDAWLDYAKVIETATGDRMENRAVEIELRFLGPFHDRRIYLEYKDVSAYEFKVANSNRGHGDLWTHELQIDNDGNLVHELAYIEGGSMKITCRDLHHREEPYSYK